MSIPQQSSLGPDRHTIRPLSPLDYTIPPFFFPRVSEMYLQEQDGEDGEDGEPCHHSVIASSHGGE